jgi:hypothetical protein
MGELVIQCPETGRQISTGYEADPATFQQMPVFFSVTYCPICRTDHQWFARDARVVDPTPNGDSGRGDRQQRADVASKKHWMRLDEFVRAANVERYRRMLQLSKEEAERRAILNLLSEEIARQHSKSLTRRTHSGDPAFCGEGSEPR